MTTKFRISDAFRCILSNAPGSPNLAAPAEAVCRSKPLRNSTMWRESLSRSANRVTVARWDGLELRGLASAQVRSGARAWEVDRFHLNGALPSGFSSKDPGSGLALELLEELTIAAANHRAERLFLRLPSDSPVAEVARQTGFFPYYAESHLRGYVIQEGMGSATAGLDIRPTLPEDDFALFQLYCSATPHSVRSGCGVTLDQWKDSLERGGPQHRELAFWDNGRIIGWLVLDSFGKVSCARYLARPDQPECIAPLLDLAASQPGEKSWLVPDYQGPAATILCRNGLREAGNYTMLIKKVAAAVVNREFSLAEA